MRKMTIQLTSEQRAQVKAGLGKEVGELDLSFAGAGRLSEAELDQVHGGAFDAYLQLAGIKGESTDVNHATLSLSVASSPSWGSREKAAR
jgi:hypothetical protein